MRRADPPAAEEEMMNTDVVTCRDCKWAKWQLTKNGRINPHRVGDCLYEIPPLPKSVHRLCLPICKSGIIVDALHTCPCWGRRA